MGAPMNDTAQTLTDQFRLTVDYGQSLPEMIAAGHYDWTNDNITVNRFPITGAGTVSVEARLFHLFHLDCHISSEDVVEAIKSADTTNPWEPAKIEHLLTIALVQFAGLPILPAVW